MENKFEVIEEGLNNRTGFFKNPDGFKQSGSDYLPMVLKEHQFSIFIFALGTNDMQKFFSITPDLVENKLKTTIDLIKTANSNARIIILPPVLLNETVLNGSFRHQFDEQSIISSIWIQKIYQDICKKENCEFVDINKHITPSIIDGLHFDPKAHETIATLVKEQILTKEKTC